MSSLPYWPSTLHPQNGGRPIYVSRPTSGTTTIDGSEQIVASDAGYWKFVFQDIPIRKWEHIQVWDALALLFEGRLNPFVVRLCEGGRRQPWVGSSDAIPFSDGTFFSDGSGFSQSPAIGTVAGAVAMRSVQVTINKTVVGTIMPAHFFSVGLRLYQVKKVVSQTDETATVKVLPPWREDTVDGADAEFGRPVCKVRLATDNEMERVLEQNRFGKLSVTFLEDPS